jgi:phage anti-repressor protein
LNEGIDIPICDSVFITDPNNNIENLVQRMSRANRICLTKTECQIYMYCNEKKISKVLDYINTNTNNELCDKIYKIRFDNKTKPIETKYNLELNSNYIIKITDFLKKYLTVPKDFIDDFYSFYDKGNNDNNYIIDFDKLIFWLGVKKGHLKTLLESNFEENNDYIVLNKSFNGKGMGIGKNNRKPIMLRYTCAKELCMISRYPKSKNIREYFFEINKCLIKYNKFV